MEQTITYPNGTKANFRMTKEKGFFTSHIWVYKNGKPYLHIIPDDANNSSRVHKNCEGSGYLPMGEIMKPFDSITIDDVKSL